MTRRDLLRALLAIPAMAALDVEQLLWVPKPIIVVPAMPVNTYITGEMVAREWECYLGTLPDVVPFDNLYDLMHTTYLGDMVT